MSKGLINRILNKLATVEQHDLTANDIESTLSGASIDYSRSTYCINGKVCQLILTFTNSNSIAAGGNLLTATVNNTNLTPKQQCGGTGFYGVHSLIVSYRPSGELVVRNASSTALALGGTGYAGVSLTYLIN